MTPADALPYAFLAWLALTFGTYAGIRAFIHRRGEPEGWRFNHHGAHAFPGHVTFYEREGGHAVRFRSTILFPLFWKVQVTPEPGAYLDPETRKHAPVWSAIPWAYELMAAYAADERARGDAGD
jgi:hypothetical protein